MGSNLFDEWNASSPEPDPLREWCWSQLPEDAAGHMWAPSCPDGYLCLDCLGNDAIRRSGLVADANDGICLYCGRTTTGGAGSVHAVIEFIYSSLRSEYDDGSNTDVHVPYDVREMFGRGSISTGDLLHELGERLGNDLLDHLEKSITHHWVQSGGLSPHPWERMAASWRHFAEAVRTGPRLLRRDNVSSSSDTAPLMDVLHHLDVTASHLQTKLVEKVEAGEVIVYRARAEKGLTASRDLGSPPPRKAGPQRMSAAGVCCFYAAEDAGTAVAEIDACASDVSIARWSTGKSMIVFDIAQGFEVPSIFDYIGRNQREYIQFLNSFRRALIEPADPEMGKANFYLPTQIFAEHLRYHLVTSHQQGVDAIRYPSEKSETGINWCFYGRPDWEQNAMEFLGTVDT